VSADPGSTTVSSADPALWSPQDECRELLAEQPLVIPVVGAGISQNAGLPGTADLTRYLIENSTPDPAVGSTFSDPGDLMSVADDITNGDAFKSDELRDRVAKYWETELAKVQPASIVRLLIKVPSRLIVTFNYDRLLEKAALAERRSFESWAGLLDLSKVTALARQSDPPERLTIFHLHGSSKDHRTIIIDSVGYQEIGGTDRVNELFAALMEKKRLCFIGTQMDEVHLLAKFQQATRGTRPHPLFVTSKTKARLRQRMTPLKIRHGIQICNLPSNDHLEGLVNFLARPVSRTTAALAARTGATVARSVSRGPDSQYVPTVIATCDEERDDRTTDYLALLALGGRRRRSFVSEESSFLTEEDLAKGHRDLLLGVPGSGKSELIRYTGTLASGDSQSMLIRLVDVQPEAAEPRTRLLRWAERGEAFTENTVLSHEALESKSFHFFLDGLDEVAPGLQERFARQIAEVADAHPQHAVTVASRPVEAASLFPRESWRCLSLEPGSVWQQRYLERHEIAVQDLIGELEGGRDLWDLLKLPFFLVRIVALHNKGELAGLDLWGVVRKLIDSALQREEPRLPVSPEAARQWLKRAALAMQLAGRSILEASELDQIPLEGSGTADRDEICMALVQRAMLEEREKGYVFLHRIIGEALAAEALLDLDPSEELLLAIAPTPTEEIRGVRDDWRVPLTFMLPTSEAWRSAIKPRDPLQWARSVPSSAPLHERREAAELIWNTYLDWQIWIWDRDLPDVTDDATALTRHLRGGGLDDLIERIRSDLDHPSAQVQGNALRVLSRAGIEGLSSELERILEADDREAVVRRKAAIAAADLGLHELLPLIVERGAHPEEAVEAQDAAIASMQLATDKEVAEVAQRLLESEETEAVVLTRIGDRLNPKDMLVFLRDYAALRNQDPYSTQKDLLLETLDRFEEPESEAIRDAGFIATAWHFSDPELVEFLDHDHDAALLGVADAIEAFDGAWWRAFHLFSIFSADELERAGAEEAIVERRRQQEEWQRKLDAGEEVPELAPPQLEEEPEREKRPTLPELLQRPREEADWIIQHHANVFAGEVTDLTEEEQADLSARLLEWWPEDASFHEAITFKERKATRSTWSIKNWANAWLWFGPKLNQDLRPEQWAGIAMSGVLYEEQFDWLQSKATSEGKELLAAQCESEDIRIWFEALRATPDPLPQSLIDSLLQHLGGKTSPSYELRSIAQRLTELKDASALRALAGDAEELQQEINPFLAKLGESDAVELMLQELAESLRAGQRPDRDDLSWLDGALDERYLDQLFECLVLVYTTQPSSGIEWVETGAPLTNAIQIIGGEKAIQGYDTILEEHREAALRFSRLSREKLVQAELAEAGVKAASQAAQAAGVPYLG
jgi:hypothetical protein